MNWLVLSLQLASALSLNEVDRRDILNQARQWIQAEEAYDPRITFATSGEIQTIPSRHMAFIDFFESIDQTPVDQGRLRFVYKKLHKGWKMIRPLRRVAAPPAEPKPKMPSLHRLSEALRSKQFRLITAPTPRLTVISIPSQPRSTSRFAIELVAERTPTAILPAVMRFFLDPISLAVLDSRSEVHYDQQFISGRVEANDLEGVLPYGQAPFSSKPVGDISITQTPSGIDFLTNKGGDFSGWAVEQSPLSLSTSLISGQFQVFWQELPYTLQNFFDGNEPILIRFNQSQTEDHTAAVSAFLAAKKSYELLKSHWPNRMEIERSLPIHVNKDSHCNAFYFAGSLNFLKSGAGCVNTAYSTIVAHEYAHSIIDAIGLLQGAFGEGVADTFAAFVYDDPVFGRGFFGSNTVLRDPLQAQVRALCRYSVHYCGQSLSGAWLEIKSAFEAEGGEGRILAQGLFLDWLAITLGGPLWETALSNEILAEILLIDDDDGDLSNGSPHFDLLCQPFARRGILCPERSLFTVNLVQEPPRIVPPGSALHLLFSVWPQGQSTIESARILWRQEGNSKVSSAALLEVAAQTYFAEIPAGDCFDEIQYIVELTDQLGRTQVWPNEGFAKALSFTTATQNPLSYREDFESGLGWSVQNAPYTSGGWQRGVPLVNTSEFEPQEDFDQSGKCYTTGLSAQEFLSGQSILYSPVFSLATVKGPSQLNIGYARYFSVDPDFNLNQHLDIEWSTDNWQTSHLLESVTTKEPQWRKKMFRIAIHSTSVQFQLRLIGSSAWSYEFYEAALDDLWINHYSCLSSTNRND